MDPETQGHRDYGFVIGLMTGAVVGAGLALGLAPRGASELRERMTDSARNLNERTSERFQQVNARVGGAVDLTRTGQGVRGGFATTSSTQSLARAVAGSPNWMLYNSA